MFILWLTLVDTFPADLLTFYKYFHCKYIVQFSQVACMYFKI